MEHTNTKILCIGYGRHMFSVQNAERERLMHCADAISALHAIVFSQRDHNLTSEKVSEKFILYPTHSRARLFMIVDAVRLGLRILKSDQKAQWTITTQDPLGAGIAGFLLKLWTGLPLIVQEHGDIFSGNYWKKEKISNRVWHPIAQYILRRADRVRVVSNRVEGHIQALGIPEEKIVVLPVYTDVALWKSIVPATDLHMLHPHASVIVLTLARFVPQKNLTLLIRAFSSLHAKDPRALLVLVGQGEEKKTIEKEIQRYGISSNVVQMPWTHDAPSLMKTADIYALSSHYEGWGRVLIEALLSGLPMVTTRVGCVDECVLHNVHALTVSVGDEQGFCEALVKLACDKNLQHAFKKNALRDAEHVFPNFALYQRAWVHAHTLT